ncbi:MAG: serine protease [Gammaproteobacteria bacterium]|nr:serine protease [Gammaproteobacteria bacterium]
MTDKTVSLVLSSGGARGLAHIGVIQWLEEKGYDIQSVAGSSMGALVGGIYAAGELETYTNWVRALRQVDVLRLLDFSFEKQGLLKGERVVGTLKELVGDHTIEELGVSFTAVATNVEDNKEVWLNKGSLFSAIRASIAIPTLLAPAVYRGRALLDGSLINPIPISPTLRDKTDLTIAVNLSGSSEPAYGGTSEVITEVSDTGSYRRRVVQFVDALQQRLARNAEEEMGVFNLISSAMETMQVRLSRFILATHSPDVVIDVPRNSCSFFDFYRADEMIELGRERAARVLDNY